MSIIARFSSIVSANINAQLDKMENPAVMIDQYLREMMNDLAQVKKETAGVMAEEARCKRERDQNVDETAKYAKLTMKALEQGNEEDARVFLSKKQELEAVGASLETSYAVAHENAVKMRQMHDKLVRDINDLKTRKEAIKSKIAVAKTQEKVNKISTGGKKDFTGKFEKMEAKADAMLDRATAMADLNSIPVDEAMELEKKYKGMASSVSVEDELTKMKLEMGLITKDEAEGIMAEADIDA